MTRCSFALLLAVAMLAPPPPAAAAPVRRPVAAEDLFRLALVSDSQISPDGSHVVFVVSRMNGPSNRYDTDLWTVATAGGDPAPLTSDGHASDPAWSPDGSTVAFTDDASGVPHVLAVDVATRKTSPIFDGPQAAFHPVYSHDGKHVAFAVVTVDPQPKAQIDFAAAGFTPKPDQTTSDVRIIHDERYEANGEGYTYDKHVHLWIANADGSGAHRVTPESPWSESLTGWSPDDTRLLFTSLRRETPLAGESDVYTVPAAGGTMQRVVSAETANTWPAFAPDSQRVYYLAGGVKDSAEYPALVVSRLDGSARRTLYAKNLHQLGDWVLADLKMPGAVCGPLVLPGGHAIVTNLSGPGVTELVRIDTSSGKFAPLTNGGEASDCTVSRDGSTVAYVYADFTHPAEVYALDLRTGRSRALTALNAAYLASVELSHPQPMRVRDEAGFQVPAWFMPAVGPKSGGRRPTIVAIHGGPQAEAGETFFHEMQYWCGLGYNVVLVNARGSIGYGYAYERALEGHWGPPMQRDVMAAVDAAASRPGVDATRLGVTGGSYGGYATLWLISHTDRFKAAIAERPASDLATQSMTWFLASPNGLGGNYAWGKPWDPHSANAADSPFTFVEHVHTPVLLLHSTLDTETPIDQTLDEFSALRQLGKTAVFVEVPGENHDLNRTGSPIHRVERLHILADWFARWLTP